MKKDGFYSTDTFTDKLVDFLDERQSSPDLKAKPFFAYHAYTAPHFPLQAPKAVRDKYKGLYDEGPRVLREKRLQKLKDLGLIEQNITPHPVANPFDIAEWDAMTPDEKMKSARAMETVSTAVFVIMLRPRSTLQWSR